MQVVQEMTTSQFLRQRRYLLLSVLAWIVASLVGILLVSPQVEFLFTIQATIETEEKKLSDLQAKVQFLESFDVGQFREQNTKTNVVLPSIKPFLPLLHTLRSLADEQQVVISGLNWNVGLVASESADPSAVPEATTQTTTQSRTGQPAGAGGDRLEELTFSVNLLGTAPNINSFLVEINTIAPIVDVVGISLVPRTQLAPDLYEATLDVVSYFAPLTGLTSSRIQLTSSLPRLTPEERVFTETLNEYRDFSSTATFSAQPANVGKQNPFAVEN